MLLWTKSLLHLHLFIPSGPSSTDCRRRQSQGWSVKLLSILKALQNLLGSGYPICIRVPLSQLHSTTYAFYPDETHNAIRRVFTPYHAPHTKRHFCGFCGTALSSWSENTPEEAQWIVINMSSLRHESLERLQNAGYLAAPEEEEGNIEGVQSREEPLRSLAHEHQESGREVRGSPWFEEMVEGSDLGRIRRRRGGQTSTDGHTRYEWEVVEIGGEEAENSGTGTAKRKLGVMGTEDDVDMRSGPER